MTKLSALSAPPPATLKGLLQMPLLLTTPGSHTEHGVWINTQQVYEGGCVSLLAMIPNDLRLGSSLPRGQATLSHPRNVAVQMLELRPVGRTTMKAKKGGCSTLAWPRWPSCLILTQAPLGGQCGAGLLCHKGTKRMKKPGDSQVYHS